MEEREAGRDLLGSPEGGAEVLSQEGGHQEQKEASLPPSRTLPFVWDLLPEWDRRRFLAYHLVWNYGRYLHRDWVSEGPLEGFSSFLEPSSLGPASDAGRLPEEATLALVFCGYAALHCGGGYGAASGRWLDPKDRGVGLLLKAGLHLSGWVGYLLIKRYREVIEQELSPSEIEFLIRHFPKSEAMKETTSAGKPVEPEELREYLLGLGWAAVGIFYQEDPLWPLVVRTVPKSRQVPSFPLPGKWPVWWQLSYLNWLDQAE